MKRELKKLEEAGQVLLQEINEPEGEPTGHKRSFWNVISIPALAILTGLIIGAILIVATSSSVYEAFSHSFGEGLSVKAWLRLVKRCLPLTKPCSPVQLVTRSGLSMQLAQAMTA